MATAWAPRKRSDSSRSLSRISGGVLPGPRWTAIVRSRRSGNSSRTSSATQPSASRGSSSSSSTRRTLLIGAPRERHQLAPQGGRVLHPDQRLDHAAAAVGERDLRADGDAVEVGQRAVAVVADREAPTVAANVAAQVAAVALDGHGGHRDRGEGRAQRLEAVELVLARRAARGEEGERHRAALPQLADVEDLGAADLAGRPRAAALLPGAGGDVGVADQRR